MKNETRFDSPRFRILIFGNRINPAWRWTKLEAKDLENVQNNQRKSVARKKEKKRTRVIYTVPYSYVAVITYARLIAV